MHLHRNILKISLGLATLLATVALAHPARAETTSVNAAVNVAKTAVSPELQGRVVSVYGVGTPAAIQKWYVIFYDGAVASHGRAVLVENGQITRTYEAKGGTVYAPDLTYDPTRITSEGLALAAAQSYAAQHNIAYDTVHALLKQNAADQPFRWRIELVNGGASRGYVYVNTADNMVASYAPAGTVATNGTVTTTNTTSTTSTTTKKTADRADADARGFTHDVKKTFLGVGGDLEQFFTGDRTVDK